MKSIFSKPLSQYRLKFTIFSQEKFVAKNTDLQPQSTIEITNGILNWMSKTPNIQVKFPSYHSESVAIEDQLGVLLNILEANVI